MNPKQLYKGEANVSQSDDGHWYYTPDKFKSKLLFLIVSLIIVVLGGVLIWDPAVRYFFGEQATARITRILREEPDKAPEIIRYRKEIPEGDHLTRFTYTVAVEQEDSSNKEMTIAVGSRRKAYANVNDDVEIIYFPGEDHAYGLYEHRTWSFGVGFLFVGFLLTACAIPTLNAVGKPILIDPEAADPSESENVTGTTTTTTSSSVQNQDKKNI